MAFLRYSLTLRASKNTDIFKKYCTISRITQPKIDAFSSRQKDSDRPKVIRSSTVDDSSKWKSGKASPVIRPHETKRISIPPAVADRLYKKKMKLIQKKVQINPRFFGPVLIQCKNKKLNHHVGQSYRGYGKDNLASAYWKKSKYVGDYFTINAIQRNPALLDKTDEASFKATGLREDICKVLEDHDIHHATNIQRLTIPTLLKGKSVMCTAETGGGKTLAFLLPMIQQVLDMKDRYGQHPRRNQPLGVILVPSHELADQIYKVTRDIAEPLGYMVRALVGRYSSQVFKRNQQRHMDILIASPGILSKAIYLKQINMERLRMIVLDEADTLMDDSFKHIMNKILLRTTKSAGISLSTSPIESELSANEHSHDPDEEWFLSSDGWQSNIEHKNENINIESEQYEMPANDCFDKTLLEEKYRDTNSSKEASHNIMESNVTITQRREIDSTHTRNEMVYIESENKNYELISSNRLLSKEKPESDSDVTREKHLDKDTISHGVESQIIDSNETGHSVDEYGNENAEVEHAMMKDIREGGLIQFCMVGASIPTSVAEILGDLVPADDVEVVKTDHIHRILPHIVQKFQRVSNDSKIELLLSTVKKNVHNNIPTIVFCNKSSTVRYLSNLIQDCGVSRLSALYKIDRRHGDRIGVFHEWHTGVTDLLVTTDLASRGLDTTRAKMVINYDFPHHMVDYLHRAGRVGRVGSQGTGIVFNFVQHKWDVDLCCEIELAARKGTVFGGINTNIKQYHNERHRTKRPDVIELNV